jgi:hypothetical protein
MYPCQKNVIRVPDFVMGRLGDELVFWEVPNIWSKYTRTEHWVLSEFSIRSIENTAIKTWERLAASQNAHLSENCITRGPLSALMV